MKQSLVLYDPKLFRCDETGLSVAFFSEQAVVGIDQTVISELKQIASKTKQHSLRICMHQSANDILHDMVVLASKGEYYRPHKHPVKAETYHIIDGIIQVFLFDDSGVLSGLATLSANDNIVYRVPPGVYHSMVVLSEYGIYHEGRSGPFDREQENIFPNWAPDGDDRQAACEFLNRLGQFLDKAADKKDIDHTNDKSLDTR